VLIKNILSVIIIYKIEIKYANNNIHQNAIKNEDNQQKIIINIMLQYRCWVTDKYHVSQAIRNKNNADHKILE
jgi:hypothetical protein